MAKIIGPFIKNEMSELEKSKVEFQKSSTEFKRLKQENRLKSPKSRCTEVIFPKHIQQKASDYQNYCNLEEYSNNFRQNIDHNLDSSTANETFDMQQDAGSLNNTNEYPDFWNESNAELKTNSCGSGSKIKYAGNAMPMLSLPLMKEKYDEPNCISESFQRKKHNSYDHECELDGMPVIVSGGPLLLNNFYDEPKVRGLRALEFSKNEKSKANSRNSLDIPVCQQSDAMMSQCYYSNQNTNINKKNNVPEMAGFDVEVDIGKKVVRILSRSCEADDNNESLNLCDENGTNKRQMCSNGRCNQTLKPSTGTRVSASKLNETFNISCDGSSSINITFNTSDDQFPQNFDTTYAFIFVFSLIILVLFSTLSS